MAERGSAPKLELGQEINSAWCDCLSRERYRSSHPEKIQSACCNIFQNHFCVEYCRRETVCENFLGSISVGLLATRKKTDIRPQVDCAVHLRVYYVVA